MTSKTWIIVQREYLQRLKSRTFILTTLLGPIALAAAVIIPIATTLLIQDDAERTIYLHDEAGLPADHLDLPEDVEVVVSDLPEDSLKAMVLDERIDGYLLVPGQILEGDETVRYVSRGGGGLQFRLVLEQAVSALIREARLIRAGAGDDVLEIIESDVRIDSIRLTDEGEGADASGFLALFGYLMAMIIYVCVFLYGSLVMRSVIEEKTSRIVEVVVSSVRPFELMLGKVLGVGALGLTQILIWIGAFVVLVSAGGLFVGVLMPTAVDLETTGSGVQPPVDLSSLGFPAIPFSFALYFVGFFLGGYLLYASLFAAIGSVVEQESDAQQFMIPVAIPIILSLLLLGHVIETPESTLSVVTSLIPFFSPVLMPVRVIMAHLPFWQAPLALILLFATFLLTVWLCARIYRTGILMYGKRPSISDILKWMRVG
jgi:ABC-2 type transport system permease protein